MTPQIFNTFVRANAADLAPDLLQAFVKGGWTETPIAFVEGKTGLGKTHLLQAASTLYRVSGVKIASYSSTEFMQEALSAERRGKLPLLFDALFRHAVLVIDDIHLALTRPQPLRTAIRLFAGARKPMILSADTPVAALAERLGAHEAALLQSGLRIALVPPDRDARQRIVAQAVREANADVPEDVVEEITHEDATAREVLSKLSLILMYAEITKMPISTDMLGRIAPAPTKSHRVAISDIVERTAEFYDLALHDFYSPQRARRVARPRQVAMYLARTYTARSLSEIGKQFGGRDHTTVLHACRRVRALRDEDAIFSGEVEFLANSVVSATHTVDRSERR